MTIVIRIRTDGAAFDGQPGEELARLLRRLAQQAEAYDMRAGKILDSNGNSCGTLHVED